MTDTRIVYQSPTKIVCHRRAIEELGEQSRPFGQRALLVSSRSMQHSGFLNRAAETLRRSGLEVIIHLKGQGEPSIEDVDKAAAALAIARPDLAIALGGGSVLDLAKGIAVALGHPGSARRYLRTGDLSFAVGPSTLPLVAVPSTAGTGSETSYYAVFSNKQLAIKDVMVSPHLFPRVALLDPELSASAPIRVRRDVGVDTLTHALEGYLSNKSSPVTDALAVAVVLDVMEYLPRALYEPADDTASLRMALASAMGGMVITSAGTGIGHALAQALGAEMAIPHGFGVGAFLPWVLRLNRVAAKDKLARLADNLPSCDRGQSPLSKVDLLIRRISELYRTIGFEPGTIRNYVTERKIDLRALARATLKQPPAQLNPEKATEGDVEQALRSLLDTSSDKGP